MLLISDLHCTPYSGDSNAVLGKNWNIVEKMLIPADLIRGEVPVPHLRKQGPLLPICIHTP